MDLLPVNPTTTNKVDTSINLANDGGSKSNTGYFSKRDSEEKAPENIDVDVVKFSKSSSSDKVIEDEEVPTFFELLKKYINSIKDFILKALGLKRKKIYNIFEKSAR